MKSIQRLSQEEKEIKLIIDSIKNVMTDVPYDFEYEDSQNGLEDEYETEQTEGN